MIQPRLGIRLNDIDTGFSPSKPKVGRPYLLTKAIGEPLDYGYVVPRSASGWEGVETPANEPKGLNMVGKFLLDPIFLEAEIFDGAEEVGMLPDAHWDRIFPRLNSFLMDLE